MGGRAHLLLLRHTLLELPQDLTVSSLLCIEWAPAHLLELDGLLSLSQWCNLLGALLKLVVPALLPVIAGQCIVPKRLYSHTISSAWGVGGNGPAQAHQTLERLLSRPSSAVVLLRE
jgi:hypothetical protein